MDSQRRGEGHGEKWRLKGEVSVTGKGGSYGETWDPLRRREGQRERWRLRGGGVHGEW
jgi:hypothetical protein